MASVSVRFICETKCVCWLYKLIKLNIFSVFTDKCGSNLSVLKIMYSSRFCVFIIGV